jgi:hypothetical protein
MSDGRDLSDYEGSDREISHGSPPNSTVFESLHRYSRYSRLGRPRDRVVADL